MKNKPKFENFNNSRFQPKTRFIRWKYLFDLQQFSLLG